MFISRLVRIMCLVAMIMSTLAGCFMFGMGMYDLITDHEPKFALLRIFIAICIPIGCIIATYPAYALANIHENVDLLNTKMDRLYSLFFKRQKTEIKVENSKEKDGHMATELGSNHLDFSDVYDFINFKYGINLDLMDDVDSLKSKVASITINSSSAIILKNKVELSETKDEIILSLKNHMVAHS